MPNLFDAAYLLGAAVTSPIWFTRMARTGKLRTDWPGRFGKGPRLPESSRPRILLHAVSVGEVNAMRLLVEALSASEPSVDVVIATTTDTGFARAQALFASQHHVIRYPFDTSWAVRRVLDRIQPDVVGLVELEVWPNFLRQCMSRSIPVALVNGRLSERSFRRYRRLGPLARSLFSKLERIAV